MSAKKKIEQEPTNEEKKTRYLGPWYRVEATAMHSKNYSGKVDLGTFTEPEQKKGIVAKRVDDVTRQGYKNVNVREIPAEKPVEEAVPCSRLVRR